MFKCESCQSQVAPGTTSTLIPVKTRKKTYPKRRVGDKIIDNGGEGFETVCEIRVCPKCRDRLSGTSS